MWFCITNTFTYNNRLRITGVATNYSWSLSSTSSDSPDFGTTGSFSSTPASGALAGGVNAFAGTTYTDYGTVTVVVGGSFTASACYGPNPAPACNGVNNSTAAQVASALAGSGATGLNRPGSPVSVVPSGASLNFTYGTQGTVGNGVTVSYSSASAQTQWTFSPPSFTSNTPNITLGGALNWGDLNANPLVTQYQYDSRGNLLCVEQHGSVTGTGCSAAASNDATSPWRVRRFTYDSFSRLLAATNPEAGTIAYAYDADSNLLQRTSPAPNQPVNGTATQPISYCYDELHRATGKAYGAQTCQGTQLPQGTAVVSYTYDSAANAKGKLVSLTDQAGTANYSYDSLGRTTTEQRTIAGISNTIGYAYNLDGSLKSLTYPSNRVVNYTPDSAGRLISAIDATGTNYVSTASYNAPGALTGLTNSANVTSSFFYNPRLQLCRITAWTSGSVPTSCTDPAVHGNLMDRGYNFNLGAGDNGNVISITNHRDPSRSQSFTYDALNRITSGWSTANTGTLSWGENYTIDAWGNLMISRMSGKDHGGNFQCAGDDSNRATCLGYDAAGNVIANGTASYFYDQENRLSSTADTNYVYDANGSRVKKSSGATGTLYWYASPGIIAETDLTGTLKSEYVFFGGKRVARIDSPENSVHYYLSDHLNSTTMVVSPAGAPEEESDYSPYGTEYHVTSAGANHYKFTGKERDTESVLDYFGARYYSSVFARWTSVDPGKINVKHLHNPQKWHKYAHVLNNPLALFDPDGKEEVTVTIRAYIPQASFRFPPVVGPLWKGDGRGPSVDATSYRVQAKVTIETDPAISKSSNPIVSAVASTSGSSVNLDGIKTLQGKSELKLSATGSYDKKGNAVVQLHVAGADPASQKKSEDYAIPLAEESPTSGFICRCSSSSGVFPLEKGGRNSYPSRFCRVGENRV